MPGWQPVFILQHGRRDDRGQSLGDAAGQFILGQLDGFGVEGAEGPAVGDFWTLKQCAGIFPSSGAVGEPLPALDLFSFVHDAYGYALERVPPLKPSYTKS